MLTLLILLLVLGVLFGGYGSARGGWGYYGWSPLGFLLLVFLVLWVGGYLR